MRLPSSFKAKTGSPGWGFVGKDRELGSAPSSLLFSPGDERRGEDAATGQQEGGPASLQDWRVGQPPEGQPWGRGTAEARNHLLGCGPET